MMIDYQHAIDYLNSFRKFGIRLRLGTTTELLSKLGNPEKDLRVIHVAGTNGKGSSCAILSSILHASSYKVGLFTSPHLLDFEERIQINGERIERKEISNLVELIKPLAENLNNKPTFFEVVTALSLKYFQEKDTDIVILETGLGGRFDATNVVNPLISIITEIALDHTQILGNSIQEIAREKAGIIKNAPVVSSARNINAIQVIENVCREKGVDLFLLGRDFFHRRIDHNLEGQIFEFDGIHSKFQNLEIPLLGEHQLDNAAVSLSATELLQGMGFDIPEEKIRTGLAQVRWPGRMEIIRENPLILLDGAHNPSGINALKRSLRDIPYDRVILIIAASRNKDLQGMVSEISPVADQVIATSFTGDSFSPEEIKKEFKRNGKEALAMSNVKKAIDSALSQAENNDLILVTGSLFLVGEARKVLMG